MQAWWGNGSRFDIMFLIYLCVLLFAFLVLIGCLCLQLGQPCWWGRMMKNHHVNWHSATLCFLLACTDHPELSQNGYNQSHIYASTHTYTCMHMYLCYLTGDKWNSLLKDSKLFNQDTWKKSGQNPAYCPGSRKKQNSKSESEDNN